MIPILFPADAATYTTQGLGALSDAISCRVREERNGEFELEMQYPQAGLHFSEISDRCIILAIPSPWRAAQPFRIYRITKPLNGVCTIYARHITYDLSGIPVNVFSAQSAAGALSGLKANSATANPFEFWTDKQTPAAFAVSVPASIRSLLGGSTGSVLDVYGGEYEWDGWTVRLHEHRGTDRGVTIRYGKNLTDIEQDRNIANVRTGLYPYWADNDGNLVVCDPPIVNAPGSYDFINIQAVDFSQEWQEAPTPAQLKARAEQYIQANEIGVPTVSISVSFVDLSRTDQYKDLALLEQCDLCDTVTVQFEALGIDATAEVVSIETDVLLERYNKIEVGSLRTNIADTIVDNQQRTDEQIKQTASYLEDRIQQSTDLITNGGGYIYRKFDAAKNWVEIGSTDNLDLNKAVHVWRWNNGGFGYSGTGYNGPYRTAITQDGHIVADFVDTGSLTANIVKAGILQNPAGAGHTAGDTFFLDLDNGILRMNAAQISINSSAVATKEYTDAAEQDAKDYASGAAQDALDAANAATDGKLALYPTTVEMNSAITQTASQITSQVSQTLTQYSTTSESQAYADGVAGDAETAANAATDNKLKNYSTTVQMNSAIDQKANQITLSVNQTLTRYSTTEESEQYADQAAGQAEDAANAATDNKLKNYSTTVQMNSAIDQKANQITLSVNQTLTRYSTTEESEQYADQAAGNAESAANAATDTKLKNYSTTVQMQAAIDLAVDGISLSVSNNGTQSTLTLKSGNATLSSANIEFNGYVTFGNLSTSGQTTINADNLKTGTIDASSIRVVNLSADNITSGTLRGRAINGGTIKGCVISGSKFISEYNNTSIQIYDGKFLLFGTSNTSRLRIRANGDLSGEIDFWTTNGFWCGKIRGYQDGDLGRIEVSMGNNGFFTADRIQTGEISVSNDKMYSDGYKSLNGNYLMRYENGIRQCWLDRLALNGGVMYSLQWVNINGHYALCRV